MTNYIEIKYEYVDGDGDKNVEVRWAVRPTPDELFHKDGRRTSWLNFMPWQIEPGSVVSVYNQLDIDALRKLLDEIETQLKEEPHE